LQLLHPVFTFGRLALLARTAFAFNSAVFDSTVFDTAVVESMVKLASSPAIPFDLPTLLMFISGDPCCGGVYQSVSCGFKRRRML
jgi:hypothetical protein